MSIEVSPSPPGSPMTGLSSYPSTEQLRTISEGTTHPSSVSCDLSSLSLLADIEDGKSGHKDAVEIKPKPKGDSAGKKRRRDSSAIDAVAKKPKIDMDGENKEKGIYCHQCRTRQEAENVLRCTRLKQFTKNGAPRACNLAWCDRDLAKRYGTNASAARERGRAGEEGEFQGHDPEASYLFICPCCSDQCQNSTCRKKKGLEPLGMVTKPAQEAVAAFFAPKLKPNPAAPKQPADSSTIMIIDSGSELSEIDSADPVDGLKPAKTARTRSKPKTAHAKPKPAETASGKGAPKKVVKGAKTGKSDKGQGTPKQGMKEDKGKGKAKVDGGEVVKKPRAKPVRKPEVPVEPPAFEKVDTRLGKEEAEQRIALREYIARFRPVLSVPERSLGPLDDFDRFLSEATVRLFAGAMLDIVREELEVNSGEEELIEIIQRHREELRYYADLARFATIFNALSTPLALRLQPSISAVDRRADANASAIRALLDLDENQAAPAWATDFGAGPSRRVGASRIPQPSEVVRMLLALAERSLSARSIRADLDSTSGENEERRRHASGVKKETTAWEGRKKKLAEARVRCKSAAETKVNKELTTTGQREHDLLIAWLNVNLRASLGRRALRHEPLGIDLDGRIYHILTPRPVEDDARPPVAWASGLLVWGTGVPLKADVEAEEDELPVNMERWSHFGKSVTVKQLAKWIEWRTKQAIQAARPVKSPAKPKATPNGKMTPKALSTLKASSSKLVQSTLTPSPSKIATTRKMTPRVEVVIPISARKFASNGSSSLSSLTSNPVANGITLLSENDDASDTSSGLSTPPVSSEEDLLPLLNPKGYKPSISVIEENGKELARRLMEVAEWLEVLEWRGMGERR